MGGGTEPSFPPDAEEDDHWAGFRYGDRSPWSTSLSLSGRVDGRGEVRPAIPAAGMPTPTAGHPATPTMYASRRHWSADLDVGDNDSDAFQSGGLLAPFHRSRMDERENNVAVSKIPAERCVNTQGEEGLVQDVHMSKVSADPTLQFVTPSNTLTSRRSGESSKPVQKKIFKLMQIENDNQDLSFVEKVILSRDEIFRLCNDIRAGSAHSSEGRRIIDFGGLNSKLLTVVGFFGSKDVMRDVFENSRFREQRDVWVQIQNDTFAPGLYAWLHDNSLSVFYWHQGPSLPEASRKDMSCNFIRYIFDLCDTVCVCLEGKNLKNSLFESTPKFSKRRTQRLQISLVKESEDSVNVEDGFSLDGLTLGKGTVSPAPRTSKNRHPLNPGAGHDYRLSEGQSRVALLVSSTLPGKLKPLKERKEINISAFSAFIKKWTVDNNYSLDLKNLSDADFVVFIRSAKLKDATDYDELVARNSAKKKEERNKTYIVDRLAETEQERLSRCLESFIDSFFKTRYPWEENLRLLEFAAHVPLPPNKIGHSQQSEQAVSPAPANTSVNLSHALNQVEAESHPALAEDARAVIDVRLHELEKNIYDILLDKDSTKRLVFPDTAVFVSKPNRLNGEVFTLERSDTTISKFVPISYGEKVTVRSAQDPSHPAMTGVVRSFKSQEEGPLLTGEDITIKVDGQNHRMKLEPVCATGDLINWLHWQTVDMKFPFGWKHVALLTAISQKLAESEREIDLTVDLAREALVSASPLELLEPILPEPVLQLARREWEELRHMQVPQISAEMQQTSFYGRFKDLCVSKYGVLRSDFQSKILAQIRRFAGSLLIQKVRKQCLESCQRLEAICDIDEGNFLAARKDFLSQRKDSTSSLTLTFEVCRSLERPAWKKIFDGGQKISISFVREAFEKESIAWHGFELAPMKADLDQLIIDNDHTFRPTCSAGREIIDLDPSNEALLKVVFLKAGQVLVFITEGHNDAKSLVLYLCPKLGVKASTTNCIRRMS